MCFYIIIAIFILSFGFFNYKKTKDTMIQEIHKNLTSTASLLASEIEEPQVSNLLTTMVSQPQNFNKTSKEYNQLLSFLRKRHTPIKDDFIYIYTLFQKDHHFYFGIDTALPIDKDHDGQLDQAQWNERYDTPPPALLESFNKNKYIITQEPYTDAWGTFYSIFYPIKNKEGKIISVLGIDLTVSQFITELTFLKSRMIIFNLVCQFILLSSFIFLLRLINTYELNKSREQDLIQSQKLIEVGMIAASVTHEINNPLSVIKMTLDILELKKELTESGLQRINKINDAILKIQKIISQMKNFVRKNDEIMKQVIIDEVIDDSLIFLKPKLYNILVNKNLNSGYQKTYCHDSQITQVLINLIVNAIEAIEKETEPKLWIESSLNNNFYQIKIKNSGPTIPDELLEKINKGFFSTKEKDKGSGMGLMISKMIVQNHGGTLEYSIENNHSTFTINLPIKTENSSTIMPNNQEAA